MKPKRRSQLKDENINSKLLGADINSINIEKYRDITNNKKQKINLNGKLNANILKTISNKFSPEIIFSLNIMGQGLTSIDALSECENLIVLNISQNKISSLQPISKLKQLWIVNASKNDVNSLEALSGLKKLINLHIEGNDIRQSNQIKPLLDCTSLQNLYLQNLSMTETNPLCETSGYRKNIISMLQKVKRLDGIPKGIEMNPGKELVTAKKDIKIQLKSNGSFYALKFPLVTTSFQPLTGESQLKKSIDSLKSDLNSLDRLIKAALTK